MEPHPYSKRILLCVTGLSPQIVTETLYALVQGQQPAFVPTEIHVITTQEGAERVRLTLLDAEYGHFPRLCADYGLDPAAIRFDESTLHLIPDPAGQPLGDIRSRADNVAAADTITRVVRELTLDPAACVHASIAGGRKTMGFFLGYALSLFGRPQDQLSHVLVSAPSESHPEFYYPPARPRMLYTRDNRPIDTRNAEVVLADIPFVRLREGLDTSLLEGQTSFSETVEQEGLTEAFLEEKVSRINRILSNGLGNGRARPYQIVNEGPKAHSVYQLRLKPGSIRFASLTTED